MPSRLDQFLFLSQPGPGTLRSAVRLTHKHVLVQRHRSQEVSRTELRLRAGAARYVLGTFHASCFVLHAPFAYVRTQAAPQFPSRQPRRWIRRW